MAGLVRRTTRSVLVFEVSEVILVVNAEAFIGVILFQVDRCPRPTRPSTTSTTQAGVTAAAAAKDRQIDVTNPLVEVHRLQRVGCRNCFGGGDGLEYEEVLVYVAFRFGLGHGEYFCHAATNCGHRLGSRIQY